jgi:hypothetical protein
MKVNKSVKIFIFCTIFVVSGAFAQKNTLFKQDVSSLVFPKKLTGTAFYSNVPVVAAPLRLNPIPGNFYSANLGFFCKRELQLEKITKFPFKFRLGSVEECDRLEGKSNVPIR